MSTTKGTTQAAVKGQSQRNSTNKGKSSDQKTGKSSNETKKPQIGASEKTKTELLEMAKKLEITGRHDMTKDELIKAIDKQGKK